MDGIFWKRFNCGGSITSQSKTHLTFDGGNTTLCGAVIPKYVQMIEVEGDSYTRADCKKCLNKNN